MTRLACDPLCRRHRFPAEVIAEAVTTSTVMAAAVSKNFGGYQDAAVREPVLIAKNSRPRTVLIAYEDYSRLARRDRRVEATAMLSDDDLTAVEASEMEPGLDHLDTELTTDKNAAG